MRPKRLLTAAASAALFALLSAGCGDGPRAVAPAAFSTPPTGTAKPGNPKPPVSNATKKP